MNSGPTSDAIPAEVMARLIRDTWDPLEVKVVLVVAYLGGLAVPVAERDVLVHELLQRGLRMDGSGREARERSAEALERATARGTVIRLGADDGAAWFLLGTDANRRRARAGVVIPSATGVPPVALRVERPSVFALYEQNVGLVTPIIADRLVEALDRYPEAWVADAIAEAVGYNKRNWRYIQRILENWATEGRSHETHRGTAARDLDREKHLRGKYAEVFRRTGE